MKAAMIYRHIHCKLLCLFGVYYHLLRDANPISIKIDMKINLMKKGGTTALKTTIANVAVLKFSHIWDSMTNDFIDRCANTLWKLMIPE